MSKSLTVRGFPSSACMIKLLTTRPSMKISINSVFAIGIVYWPWSLRKRRKKSHEKSRLLSAINCNLILWSITLQADLMFWKVGIYSRFYLSYSYDNELIPLIVIYPLYTTNQRLNNCQMTVESKHAIAFVTIGDWWLVIAKNISRHLFNQWEPKPKPKPIAPCTHDFSRALSELQVIATNLIGSSRCLLFWWVILSTVPPIVSTDCEG